MKKKKQYKFPSHGEKITKITLCIAKSLELMVPNWPQVEFQVIQSTKWTDKQSQFKPSPQKVELANERKCHLKWTFPCYFKDATVEMYWSLKWGRDIFQKLQKFYFKW